MKTAISLPDKVHRDADRLARRLGKSRSRLYADALTLYMARYDGDGVTDALNAVYESSDSAADPGLNAAALHALKRSEW